MAFVLWMTILGANELVVNESFVSRACPYLTIVGGGMMGTLPWIRFIVLNCCFLFFPPFFVVGVAATSTAVLDLCVGLGVGASEPTPSNVEKSSRSSLASSSHSLWSARWGGSLYPCSRAAFSRGGEGAPMPAARGDAGDRGGRYSLRPRGGLLLRWRIISIALTTSGSSSCLSRDADDLPRCCCCCRGG